MKKMIMTLVMVVLFGFRANAYGIAVASEAYAYAGGAYAYAYAGNGDVYTEVWSEWPEDEWYEWPEEVEWSDVPEPEQGYSDDVELSKQDTIAPYGSYGTLKIHGTSINRSLDLINSPESAEYVQNICDDTEKAVALDDSWYYECPVSLVIADHSNQDFNELYDLELGRTCEIFHTDGSSQKYVLRNITMGENTLHGINVNGSMAGLIYPSDWIVVYTCNPGGWQSVTVTFWEPLR